jgi:geranylgeranylglycerol-phosphate geranylgeranyltransferase
MTLNPFIRLLRPSNVFITSASVFLSALLAGGSIRNMPAMMCAAAAAGLIGGAGMVINDYFDIEIDRINKPDRPLPSGSISKRTALLYYGVLTASGLLLNIPLNSETKVISVAAVVLIFFYSSTLKRTPLFGNLSVGSLTGLAFIYGGAAVGNIERAFIPAVFAFLINVGREIIKDMEDVEGDARLNAQTFPIKFGMVTAGRTATFFLLAVIAATFIPFLTQQYGLRYLIVVCFGVNCVIAYVVVSLWKNRSTVNLHKLSTILKYDMIIGLIALYLG